ncbi:MAG: BamA/TamA family outer membrane protein [Raineya sp.]|jgi:outer membrane protein assembly factor BamA|nr:BamA/TamA family outer membrane protein [Raineya sp.]
MSFKTNNTLFKILLFVASFASSCSSFIPDKNILYKQSIKGNNNVDVAELEALYRQRVNRKFYKFMPYASIYEKSRQKLEKQKLQDSLIRFEYAKLVKEKPSDSILLKKELDKKLHKIGFIDYRLYQSKMYYDTLVQRAYNRQRSNNKKDEKRYYKIRKKRDKKVSNLEREKEKGNFWMRVVGEPFSIYDSANTEKTRREMRKYLMSKGYYSNQVSVEVDSVQLKIGKKPVKTVNVLYKIKEGLPHKIDSIYYVTTNPVIDSLIRNTVSKVKVGQILERSIIDQERNRIEALLLENGYYHFDKQYIIIQVDSNIRKSENVFVGSTQDTDVQIKSSNLTHVRFIINNPQRKDTTKIQNGIGPNTQIYLDNIRGEHIQYKIKQVSFVIREEDSQVVDTNLRHSFYPTNKSEQVRFFMGERRYSQKILYNKILFHSGMLYQKGKFDKTNQNLAGLNLFKFRSIQTKDNRQGDLDVSIIVTPYEKYALNNDIGMTVSQNVPGPFLNTSLGIRNIFGGCGILETNFLFSIDGQASFINLGDVYRTTQISFGSTYITPILFFPGKFKFKPSINALNPSTRISASVSFVSRPEYGRRNLRLAMTYNWHKSPFKNFGFLPIDVNIINTYRKDTLFQKLLDDFALQGNNLTLSFRNALITSSSFYYEYNDIDNRKNTTQKYWRPSVEFGGTLLNLFNRTFLEKNKFFGLEYFKFMRFSNEFRFYQPLSKSKPTKMAYRLFTGLALPYGTSEILPYEKFFFSGGNTMRGWIQRRLGPGGFQTPPSLTNIEKQGNIILEANAEFRFKVWSVLNMGLFVDAGNIWTLEDKNFKDGGFSNRFYEQFAVATGAGLRFDFSFLLIRLDLGLRVLDPAKPKAERFVLDEVRLKNLFGGENAAVLNLGIGYPF